MSKKSQNKKLFKDMERKNQAKAGSVLAKTPEKRKIRILYHGDSPKVNTGFGVVAREILGRLYATGEFEIGCLGINDKGDTSSHFEAPGVWHFALPDLRSDPYGIGRMPHVIQQFQPDLIFTLNDIWVLWGSDKNGTKNWFIRTIKEVAPHTPWVLYFPVDSRPWAKEWADLAYAADKTIVYSKYAIEVLKEIYPKKDPIFIPHGVSQERFSVISDVEQRDQLRQGLGVKPEHFLIGFISRNQPRKAPFQAIEVFKMANEGYRKCTSCEAVRNLDDPKCEYCGESNEVSDIYEAPLEGNGVLYMHCHIHDPMGIDLAKVVNDNKAGKNILIRPDHNIAHGVPDKELNGLFNILDCHFLPTMAEGFGLTIIEAMAAGVVNVATRTTSVTELLEEGRGYLVTPKSHIIFDDAANTRKHIINQEKAILALKKVYEDWKNRGDKRWGPETAKMVQAGLDFCKKNSWDSVAKRFYEEIKDALASRKPIVSLFTPTKGTKFLFIRPGANEGDILNTIPAIKTLKDQYPDFEFVYAMPSKCVPAFKGRFNGLFKDVVALENLTDKTEEKPQFNIHVYNMVLSEQKYEQGTHPFTEKTRSEIAAMHLGVYEQFRAIEGDPLSDIYEIDDVTGHKARKMIAEKTGTALEDRESHYIVGIANNSSMPNKCWGVGSENWDELARYLDKMSGQQQGLIKYFMVDEENYDFATNFAALSLCNYVVTLDNSYLPFLNSINKNAAVLISPYAVESRLKHYTNARVLNRKEMSIKITTDPPPGQYSPLICNVSHGEVFSILLIAFRKWKQSLATVSV